VSLQICCSVPRRSPDGFSFSVFFEPSWSRLLLEEVFAHSFVDPKGRKRRSHERLTSFQSQKRTGMKFSFIFGTSLLSRCQRCPTFFVAHLVDKWDVSDDWELCDFEDFYLSYSLASRNISTLHVDCILFSLFQFCFLFESFYGEEQNETLKWRNKMQNWE
jgi:hypothetical protein